MSRYDGFTTVDDPRQYLNAPAMIMSGSNSPHPTSPPPMPLILQAAISYSQEFQTLSADELQTYYAEQSNLGQRIHDINNRMEVEYKMRDAATSISKLHAGDDRSSIYSTKSTNRFSKLLNQDGHSRAEKRLSKQAADEVTVSNEKIREMERIRAEMEHRKATVDRIILQHHCAVMAKALTNKPLPNHQRNRSGASTTSAMTTNTQNSRRSWVVAPNHQRNFSGASNNTDSASLATVTEHERVPPPRNPNRNSVYSLVIRGSPEVHNAVTQELEHLKEELNQLTSRIGQALPQQSPAGNGLVPYISSAFENLFQELKEAKSSLEASNTQIEHSESRIVDLQKALQAPRPKSPPQGPSAEAISTAELKHQLDAEKSFSSKWRERAEEQRLQLAKTTKSLEDVTKLSVQLEGERARFEVVLSHLNSKISDLEKDNTSLLNQKLSSTKNTSVLCQEFHNIVSDLVYRHNKELRALYPIMSKPSKSNDHANANAKTETQRILESGNSPAQNQQKSSDRKKQERTEDEGSREYDSANGREKKLSSRKANKESMDTPIDDANISTSPPRGASDSNTANFERNPSIEKPLRNTDAREAANGLSLPQTLGDPHNNSLNDSSRYDSSYDNSIQYTDESFIRPEFERVDTDASELSKSSSYYPDGPSANPSYASVAGRRPDHSLLDLRYDNYPAQDDDDGLL